MQSPFEVSVPLSSPSPHLPSHCLVSSGEGGNPSDSSQIAAEGRTEVRVRLPHGVCDHPDEDLSACLAHLWKHSEIYH